MIFKKTHLYLGPFLIFLSVIAACGSLPPATTETSTPILVMTCLFKQVAESYEGTCDVPCSVNALAVNFNGIEPKRACSSASRSVTASLQKTSTAGRWLGTMQGVKPEDPTRFEVVANDSASGSVARSPFGWFAVIDMKASDSSLQLKLDTSRQVRPNKQDIAIIERAITLLANESVWNKNDNRECPPVQTKLSMFCALMQATNELSGGVHYRQPALQAVRETLNNVDASRVKTHRIMDYNNHPDTSLKEIHDLLRAAKSRVANDIR